MNHDDTPEQGRYRAAAIMCGIGITVGLAVVLLAVFMPAPRPTSAQRDRAAHQGLCEALRGRLLVAADYQAGGPPHLRRRAEAALLEVTRYARFCVPLPASAGVAAVAMVESGEPPDAELAQGLADLVRAFENANRAGWPAP